MSSSFTRMHNFLQAECAETVRAVREDITKLNEDISEIKSEMMVG